MVPRQRGGVLRIRLFEPKYSKQRHRLYSWREPGPLTTQLMRVPARFGSSKRRRLFEPRAHESHLRLNPKEPTSQTQLRPILDLHSHCPPPLQLETQITPLTKTPRPREMGDKGTRSKSTFLAAEGYWIGIPTSIKSEKCLFCEV